MNPLGASPDGAPKLKPELVGLVLVGVPKLNPPVAFGAEKPKIYLNRIYKKILIIRKHIGEGAIYANWK